MAGLGIRPDFGLPPKAASARWKQPFIMPHSVPFHAGNLASQQIRLTALWHAQEPATKGTDFSALVARNHLCNFLLWHEEDVARRDDLGPEPVYRAKRAIDKFNQERNNIIEEMDKVIVAALAPPESGLPRSSETPGMIIDRLSILALKEYHMREETVRAEATVGHHEACEAKLARILRQRADLVTSLSELLADVVARRRTFAVYYQFKMYNDRELNPQLYSQGHSPSAHDTYQVTLPAPNRR